MKGNYTPRIPPGDNGKGSIVVRAAYTDKGAKEAGLLTTEEIKILRSHQLSPGTADTIYKAEVSLQTMFAVSLNILPRANGYIGYKKIDFTGIQQIVISATAFPAMGFVGGTIEIRLDKPDGDLIGRTEIAAVNPSYMAADSAQNAGGSKTPKAPASATKRKKAPAKIPDDFNPFAGAGINWILYRSAECMMYILFLKTTRQELMSS
ncbi:MAG: hypothetical protein WDM78_05415 [Puia sp.]